MLESFQAGEIVLLEFPHSDGVKVTRRPAVVLVDTGDDDIIIARITGQGARDQFDVEVGDWRAAGLLYPSLVGPHKLATVLKERVERRLGILVRVDWTRLRQSVHQIWSTFLF